MTLTFLTILFAATVSGESMYLYGRNPVPPMVELGDADQDGVRVKSGDQWLLLERDRPLLLIAPGAPGIGGGTGANSSPGPEVLVLLDGQQFPGALGVSSTGSAAWMHPWLGELVIDMEQVASIHRRGVAAPVSGEVDHVVLVNGDHVKGFVLEIGEVLSIETESSERLDVRWDRVGGLTLAEATPGPCAGCAAFVDGTQARLSRLHIASDQRMSAADHPLQAQSGSVTFGGIVPGDDAQGVLSGRMPRIEDILVLPVSGVVLGLATAGLEVVKDDSTLGPLGAQPTRSQAVLGFSGLRLTGPGRWRTELPRGAQRLLGTAHLPRRLARWADWDLLVRVDGREVARVPLGQERLAGTLEADLEGGSVLEIEMTSGPSGPVGAVVDLHHPVIVIDPRRAE